MPQIYRILLIAICILPPYVEPAVYMMTENLAMFLLVLSLWCILKWRGAVSGVFAGFAVAGAAFTRPTFQLLGIFLTVLLILWRKNKQAIGLFVASSLMIGSFCLFNGVKFGYFGLTPALGYNLCTKTATWIDQLPEDFPLKNLLIQKRNIALIKGESHTASQYIWSIQESEFAEAAGVKGYKLGQMLLKMNIGLIFGSPIKYLNHVGNSACTFWLPLVREWSAGNSRVVEAIWFLLHFLIAGVFWLTLVIFVGSSLTTGIRFQDPDLLKVYLICLMVVFYNMAISCLFDIGHPHQRISTEIPMIICAMLGVKLWMKQSRTAPTAHSQPRES